jgi:hypothetical protein
VDDEREALRGRRIHAALDPQEPPGLLDPFAEAAGHVGERAMMMFPTEWSRSSTPTSKRWLKTSASRRRPASATRQLRTSPGGAIPSSCRSRPLDPPSSATVTTAVRSRGSSAARRGAAQGRPVPPPNATIARRSRAVLSCVVSAAARRAGAESKPASLPRSAHTVGRRLPTRLFARRPATLGADGDAGEVTNPIRGVTCHARIRGRRTPTLLGPASLVPHVTETNRRRRIVMQVAGPRRPRLASAGRRRAWSR